nr:seryl-tRNA synthetase [Cryptomonas curvata]|mmetsp:Transcript_28474/g.59527  ORF Transcript_28474/g.59527 Transcript_28474/m.59527 type:complete len:436 (-) Transcript_28474:2255-3562(-)
MINIKLFRLGSNGFSDVIRGSQNRRFSEKSIVDQIISLDNYWKNIKFNIEKHKALINFISKKISLRKNFKNPAFHYRINLSKKKFYFLEKKIYIYEEIKKQSLMVIGNLIHNSSIISKNEKDCKSFFCKQVTNNRKGPFSLNHVDLLEKIDGVEYQKGIYISGNRGYFLKKFGIALNIALIQYGLDFLQNKGFIPIQTPYFMKKEIMAKCAQLGDFNEQLYCIKDETTKFLIATSEQPISALHSNEKIQKKKLPLKYAGFSTCFRKESGSHGKDTSGIFRVHQFEKIEQFVISDSSDIDTWLLFEDLLNNAKNFYYSLKVPFRLINIASGTLNNAASKKVDILGWFPKSQTYRELVSCSNCTDFQSRRLNISLESNHEANNFVYMLNSTLCATSRVICCVLENYQTDSGVIIPDVLKNYMGISFIPFFQINNYNK